MKPDVSNYLSDLGAAILELAVEAHNEEVIDEFERGRRTALYEVLSLMKDQAIAFGLDESAIGIKDINLEEIAF